MKIAYTLFGILLTAMIGSAQETAPKANDQITQEEINERDWKIQGEYVGSLNIEDTQVDLGVQVIALGNGKFKALGFHGGLPGAGWKQQSEQVEFTGNFDENEEAALFADEENRKFTIKDGQLLLTTPNLDEAGKLRKITRESETLGKSAPDGAIVLFDGSNADGWKNGQLSENGFLKQGTTSKQMFGDHQLHIEFRLPFMPNASGQQRGNSGIYVQGRYEVQMLDSFGLEGRQNECGGLYSIKAPDLNMCFPPMTWQTYDIDFVAARYKDNGEQSQPARITVKHNGIVIHDDVELPARKTTAAPVNPSAAPGPIYLQNHGNEVRYRNIWVVEN